MAAANSLESNSAREHSAGFRHLFLQRVCRSALTLKNKVGFSYCQPAVSGCSQQAVDQTQMLSMQEDAYCHRISAEVMKRCLYKPVAPCRRRILNRSCKTSHMTARGMLSLPVTPGQSNVSTPLLSPVSSYSLFSMFSGNTTPHAESPEASDVDEEGLASVLRPRPRYVSASTSALDNSRSGDTDCVFLTVPTTPTNCNARKRLSFL